jgi:hypothetical protein
LPPRGNSALPFSKPSSAASMTLLCCSTQEGMGDIIPNILPNGRELSDTPTRACVQRLTSKRVSLDCFSRTRFQCFLSNPPCSSFKKLIISSPRLVQGLHTMFLCKGCSRRHQGQGVQKVCHTRTSSCTLRARKRSRPRNGFCSQE